MRAFSAIAALWSVTAASQVPLAEVYGPVEKVSDMSAHRNRHQSRSRDFLDVRTPENCVFPLEVVLVQDATQSFHDDYSNMINSQLDAMVSNLNKTHPGTKFSLVTFRDKPINPFGESANSENHGYSDYCQKFEADFTDDVTVLKTAYKKRAPNGGLDPNENNFGALLATSQAKAIKWSNPNSSKLIVHVTDAAPHFYGEKNVDMKGMKKPSGEFDEKDADKQCVGEFYPTPDQVKAALAARGAYTAHIVYDPEYLYGVVGGSWQWFNRFQGQTDDFLQLNAFADSSDFWTKLGKIIKALEQVECPPVETTTTEPATTTEETTTATTITTTTTEGECQETTICKEGVAIRLGFKPEQFDLDINVAAESD